MKSEYRFLRTQSGATSFARVTLSASPASEWCIEFDRVMPIVPAYLDALRDGIAIAVREYERLGGVPHRIEVDALQETPADTSPDAVRCAATVATWKAFGREESRIVISYQTDHWETSFVAIATDESHRQE